MGNEKLITEQNRQKMHCLQRAVWRNGGRSPQKRQCEFVSLCPAGSSVEAATTPSRHHVRRQQGDRDETIR